MSICSFGSRADLHRLGEVPIPSWIQVGEPVIVLFSRCASKNGVVRFVGNTEFASGNWVGVELETPDGTWRDRQGLTLRFKDRGPKSLLTKNSGQK